MEKERKNERYDNDCDYAINAHNTTTDNGDIAAQIELKSEYKYSKKSHTVRSTPKQPADFCCSLT